MVYELRLYKLHPGNPAKHELVDRYSFEAESDQKAIDLAPGVQIPTFDNSDRAILWSEDGRNLWMLKA